MRLKRGDAEHALRAERDALAEENARLRRSVAELDVLKEVAQALAEAADFGAMQPALVHHSRAAVGAEHGKIVLHEGHAGRAAGEARTLVQTGAFTTLRDVPLPDDLLFGWIARHGRPLRLNSPRADPLFRGAGLPDVVRSLLAVPMLAHGRLVGMLCLYNKREPSGFTPDDERLLTILAAQSAQAVEQARLASARAAAEAERERVTRVFGQHTAPAVVEALLKHGADGGLGRRQHVCVMFLDLRGYTARAETWPPEDVVAYLNAVFEVAVDAVNRHGGIVHQLLGDGFMAVFGAPVPSERDCRNAVDAGLAIVAGIEAACASGALPPTRVGLGLHAGEVVAGMVGSAIHREYKVTGDVVNVAARIEKLNKSVGSRLLVSEAVWKRIGEDARAEALGERSLDGRAQPIRLYKLA